MTEQYQQREINLAGAGSGGGGSVFVFQPGAPAGGPSNVFSTWEGAFEAAQTIGGTKVIQVDDSVVSPAVVPAGEYDLTDIVLAGSVTKFSNTGTLARLELDDGVTLPNLNQITDALELVSNSLSPVTTIAPSPQSIMLLDRGGMISSTTGVPFVDVPLGSAFSPVLELGGNLGTDAINVDSGFCILICQDLAIVASDAIVGAAGFLFFNLLGTALDVETAQAGYAGAVGGNFDSSGGANALLYSAGTIVAPGTSFLYPGGTNPAGASVAAGVGQSFLMLRNGYLAGANVVHQVPGAPNPITYDILVNGVPAFSVSSDASFPFTFGAFGAFTRLFGGDIITVSATTAGASTPTDVLVEMQIM